MYSNQSVKLFLILYLFNEDCQQPMATSGFPQTVKLHQVCRILGPIPPIEEVAF